MNIINCPHCNKEITGAWYNNEISKKFAEEYPHNFSICDIDGVIRTNYTSASAEYIRFIIYESKHKNEPFTIPQIQTLTYLSASIDWNNYDYKSGIFGIKHDKNLHNFDIYKINEQEEIYMQSISGFDNLYNWCTGYNIQDIRKTEERIKELLRKSWKEHNP